MRAYRVGIPRRHAALPRAWPIVAFPLPVPEMMIRVSLSRTHWQEARRSILSRPGLRSGGYSMSSTHASLYLNLACRMSLAILRAPRASVPGVRA